MKKIRPKKFNELMPGHYVRRYRISSLGEIDFSDPIDKVVSINETVVRLYSGALLDRLPNTLVKYDERSIFTTDIQSPELLKRIKDIFTQPLRDQIEELEKLKFSSPPG